MLERVFPQGERGHRQFLYRLSPSEADQKIRNKMRNLALFVACLSFAIASKPAHAAMVPQPIVTTLVGYNLVFDEEFNEGSNLNAELSERLAPAARPLMLRQILVKDGTSTAA